jgi:putative copper resistance protein D
MLTDLLSALVRALSFIALFQAAGIVMFLAIFGRRLERASEPIRRIGFASAIAGIALVIMHLSLEAARMTGALSGVFDPSLQLLVLDSSASVAAGLRIAGLAAIVAALIRQRTISRTRVHLGLGGTVLTIAGFLFVGHTAIHPDRSWLAVLLSLHLAVVAFWFGALIPLLIVARLESSSTAMQIVDRFSRIASWWVPGILVAGVLLTAMLVDSWTVFGQSYGALLLGKVGAFLVLMVLAAMNKWRYGPVLARPSVAIAFQRTVATEYVLICMVLTATAVMTTFFSPEP